MTEQKKRQRTKKILLLLRRYIVFFLSMCFLITCCMMLFLHTVTSTTGLEFGKEIVERAAKLTFFNVVLISVLFTAIDALRRVVFIKRPIKKIADCAERIMQGDFSARIEKSDSALLGMGDFSEIADYFNRMAQELGSIETLRTDFISNVSHELKTPLAVIQNYASLLGKPNLSEKERLEYAASIHSAAQGLNSLITNILKLNKLENQQIFPAKQKFDLGEQLRECLLSFENAWEKKQLEIKTDIKDGMILHNDSELLEIVWNNLFSNAVKFTDTGETISITAGTDGGFAVVTVADTGCGIGKKDGKHIFEKFYQGDTSHATGGNGLGLALVKRVVDIIDGDISVESEPGKGSTFTVRIPE